MNTENSPPSLPIPVDRRPARARLLVPLALLGLLLLLVGQWFSHERALRTLNARLDAVNAAQQGEQNVAGQFAAHIEEMQAAQSRLEKQLAEQLLDGEQLRGLTQEVARVREAGALLEVEQAIVLAAQQLQFAGNVPMALLALQSADKQLARLNLAQAGPLRKALAKDLARLETLPQIDADGLSVRLEQWIADIDRLPLAAYQRPEKAASPPPSADAGMVKRLASAAWLEVRDLVRVQRLDRADAALLAPGQEYFIRESLRIRLLGARLALWSHQQGNFRSELKQALALLDRHFGKDDPAVLGVRNGIRQMLGAVVEVEIPRLHESVAAVRALRVGKEKR